MPCFFRALVYEVGGRTVAVQPETQIVLSMVDWVTSGLKAPGVQVASGKGSLAVEQLAAWAAPGNDSPAAARAAIRTSGENRDIECSSGRLPGNGREVTPCWEPPAFHRRPPACEPGRSTVDGVQELVRRS